MKMSQTSSTILSGSAIVSDAFVSSVIQTSASREADEGIAQSTFAWIFRDFMPTSSSSRRSSVPLCPSISSGQFCTSPCCN